MDASQSESREPQTNGLENGLGNEDERTKLRPADIDADVREMERRKRVEMIMSSKLFREELERIIELQMKDGNGPAGLLQQISDMMGIQSGKLHTTHMFRGSNCVTPINDIRGVESMGYAKGEKHLRCKLASVFRLMDLYGWSQGIHNQITARLNQDEEQFLVNPYGMLYNEITASSLIKVDMQGNVVEPGTTNFAVNTQGFLLHSSIHAARPDVKCIIHIHTPSVLAVSSLKNGLLPLCYESLVIGEVSQHPFISGVFEPEEKEKIIRNLGPRNKVLLLSNHGALCCGATVEEAFYNVYNTVLACETQMKLMPIGVDNLVLISDEARKQVYDAAHRTPETTAPSGEKKPKQIKVGELEFEALIRMLDNAGFRTGYIYRHPLVKGEVPKPKNDVEVPPAVSSLGYLIEEEELYKQGNWKKYIDGRNRVDRSKWLNSPNVYQKVEILETGTPDPKKITKWVAEGSPTHSSTPVKIESALQFVPVNTNPKEFKKLQQQIKENRLADKITSGPQSHILEGVTWEEAKKLQDANITQTGDQVILVGAASKGIIQRNFQHNALVYKTPYAKNPFDSVSDKEIEDYKRLVEKKQKGDTDYEESQSESELSRGDILRRMKSPLTSPQSATSETEEESKDEPRVLRIETKTAPRPIQAEVVLSDDIKTLDVTEYEDSRPHPRSPGGDDAAPYRCVARIVNLSRRPSFVNVTSTISNLSDVPEQSETNERQNAGSDPCKSKKSGKEEDSFNTPDRFTRDSFPPTSPICVLITEIRDVVNEIASPNDGTFSSGNERRRLNFSNELVLEEQTEEETKDLFSPKLERRHTNESLLLCEFAAKEEVVSPAEDPQNLSSAEKAADGRTSSDVDTSLAFKSDTCNSERKESTTDSPVADSSASPDVRDEKGKIPKNRKNRKRKVNPATEDPSKTDDTHLHINPTRRVRIEVETSAIGDDFPKEIKLKIYDRGDVAEKKNPYRCLEIEDTSCCEAGNDLKTLQNEVCSTITKLKGIENYFENELDKQSGNEQAVLKYEGESTLEADEELRNIRQRSVYSMFWTLENISPLFHSFVVLSDPRWDLSFLNKKGRFEKALSTVSKNRRIFIRKRRLKGKKNRIKKLDSFCKSEYFPESLKESFWESSYLKEDGVNEDFDKFLSESDPFNEFNKNINSEGFCSAYACDTEEHLVRTRTSNQKLDVILELDEMETH